MKRMAILFAIVLLAASCSNFFMADNPNMTLDEAWKETASYDYIPDPWYGYWKSPYEFQADGGGDCEDFSTYLLYLLGPDAGARMAIISIGGPKLHAIVQLSDGRLIEPQVYHGEWNGAPVLWTLSYEWVMKHSTSSGRKGIEEISDEDQKMIDILRSCE